MTNEVGAALGGNETALAAFSEKERAAINDLENVLAQRWTARSGATNVGARPQAVGYGITDSPAGLAGWMLVHGGFDKWSFGKDPAQSPTRDDAPHNFSPNGLTNTAASSARIYWRAYAELQSELGRLDEDR